MTAFGHTIVEKLPLSGEEEQGSCQVFINGEDQTADAITTLTVLNEMQKQFPSLQEPFNLKIAHNFDLPMGCGYGSSGAGALGAAIGINLLFNLDLSLMETAKFAHIAEVINHTGLGTVGGQVTGGLSITMEPGFPFYMDQIIVPPNVRVVVGSFGSISTSSILTDPVYRERIIKAGTEAMTVIQHHFDIYTYMDLCRQFIEHSELLTLLKLDHVKNLMDELNQLDIIGASMNQLGQSVFCFCDESQVEQIMEIFEQYRPTHTLQPLGICPHGPIIHDIQKLDDQGI